jgi:cysteinyl-tRNA synthetase
MQIKLYNSLTRQTEDFKPLKDNKVRMYSCGPTVYNYAHIGNMRAFLFADLMQRVLRVVGEHQMMWIMNITDIDDKTIRDSSFGSKAWKNNMGEQTDDPIANLKKLTTYYLDEFVSDIAKLGIKEADFHSMPRATEHIENMQKLILKIKENGYAYVAGDAVYFDVRKWSNDDNYGRLQKIDFDNFRDGVRIDADEYERESVSDFVLWKGRKEGEPSWDFEIDGKNVPGRPGWHLECSTMEYEILGLPFDIHTGGVDLKFPHHEDEIAQSKAGYGIDPTAVWCHNEFLEVEGSKMSKSAGNFFTLRDLVKKGVDLKDVRFAMLSAHYRTKYNFTFAGIESAKKAKNRVQDFIYDLIDENYGKISIDVDDLQNKIFTQFANDLHTPKALAEIFTFINNNQAKEIDHESSKKLIELFKKINNIFDVWEFTERPEENQDIPAEIQQMAQERFDAKKAKDFAKADALRDKLLELGWNVMDKKDSFELSKK